MNKSALDVVVAKSVLDLFKLKGEKQTTESDLAQIKYSKSTLHMGYAVLVVLTFAGLFVIPTAVISVTGPIIIYLAVAQGPKLDRSERQAKAQLAEADERILAKRTEIAQLKVRQGAGDSN